MRIEFMTTAGRQFISCSDAKSFQERQALSSLSPICTAKRAPSPFKTVCNFFKKILHCFLTKFLHWLGHKKEEAYLKVKDQERGEVKFYVCKDGRRTSKDLTFGLKDAHLREISFSDSDLLVILQKIIDKEQIDRITVSSIRYAKMLYDCGFKTTSEISFNPEKQHPFDKHVLEILKQAFRLSNPAIASALLKIQKEMVQSLVSHAICLDHSDKVDAALIKGQVEKLGQLLEHPIDFEALIETEEEESYLKKTLEEIKSTQSDHQQMVGGVSLNFSLLFCLMDATKLNFDRIIVPSLPRIIFLT